jgi:hypothetical protein
MPGMIMRMALEPAQAQSRQARCEFLSILFLHFIIVVFFFVGLCAVQRFFCVHCLSRLVCIGSAQLLLC